MVVHKRVTVLDDLGISKSGIYCIYPFSKLDSKGKGVFKIGIATGDDFYKRLEEHYHTFYPMGFYIKSIIEAPTKKKTGKTKLSYYREIEEYILDNREVKRVK